MTEIVFEKIKKFYLIQLVVIFVLTLFIVNLCGFLNGIDSRAQGELLLLSIAGATLFTALNVIINGLNFTYQNRKSAFTAFFIPSLIWAVILLVMAADADLFNRPKLTDWLMLIIGFEPIVYTLLVYRKAIHEG